MLAWLRAKLFEQSITDAYSRRLNQQGASAAGVFWASRLSQQARFDHALMLLAAKWHNRATICDIGCGYGALYGFIKKTPRYQSFGYEGIDINKDMIAACKKEFGDKAPFLRSRSPLSQVDVGLYIGTFNLCHADNYILWQDYILGQLEKSWPKFSCGLVLNITSQSHARIHNQIFYAEPTAFTARLKQHFGPSVTVKAFPTRYVDNDTIFVISR
jgi:SAM-dependent methyltransferase